MNPTLFFLRSPAWLVAGRLVLLGAIVMLAIGSLTPSHYLPQASVQDKILHFLGYAGVALLTMAVVRSPQRQLSCLVWLTALGVALEFAQLFVPGRAFELWDMAANGCGVFCAFHASRLVLA